MNSKTELYLIYFLVTVAQIFPIYFEVCILSLWRSGVKINPAQTVCES